MLADIQNYNQRVQEGLKLEDKAFDSLKRCLVTIQCQLEKPTRDEDKFQKIDGWVTNKSGKRYSVQIKVRESGDDIIFEAVKDVNTGERGRDFICKADFYFFVNRKGEGFLYWTKDIHALAVTLRDQVANDILVNFQKTRWEGNGYEMKITVDRAHGNSKLMMFFSPALFNPIARFSKIIS